MIVAGWIFVLSFEIVSLGVQANQFKEVMWILPQGPSVDMQCKADLVRTYQPQITTSWVKDDTPVVLSDGLELDNLGSLRIFKPTPEDSGLYACKVTHWNTMVTTNEIRLHTGPPGRGLGESALWIAQNNEVVGVSNVWAISIILSTAIGIIWLIIVSVLRLKRSRCCGKDN